MDTCEVDRKSSQVEELEYDRWKKYLDKNVIHWLGFIIVVLELDLGSESQ